MRLLISKRMASKLREIKRSDKKLFHKVHKQLRIFKENPFHPSLRTHKLSGNLSDLWSISIDMSIRMVYIKIEKDTIYFVDIGTHDEVYRT